MKKKITIPLELVALEEGFHIMVVGIVNGMNVRLLVDTGASHTCFDSNQILLLPDVDEANFVSIDKSGTGLGTNSMESSYFELQNFSIGDIHMVDYPVIVINMMHVNESYDLMDIEPIDGVIGSEFLFHHDAIIDYEHLEMLVTPIS